MEQGTSREMVGVEQDSSRERVGVEQDSSRERVGVEQGTSRGWWGWTGHPGSPRAVPWWDGPASQPRHGYSLASETPKYCGGHLGLTPSIFALAGVHTRATAQQGSYCTLEQYVCSVCVCMSYM